MLLLALVLPARKTAAGLRVFMYVCNGVVVTVDFLADRVYRVDCVCSDHCLPAFLLFPHLGPCIILI